ncbi:MAG TPA: SLATT domain-containing protein [Aggregatilineaceae bacterium]|nr:SLATT domain-containing protein [Aggregatilineaceae bacterium]
MTTPTTPRRAGPTGLLTEEEARLRTSIYLQQRIDYQDSYYQRRMAEFSFNSDKMLWVSAALMGFSTILSSYSVLSNKAIYALITALLPAFAAAVSAFRSLYQWQRQAAVYEDSWLALQQARLAMPDEDFLSPDDYARHFPQLVQRTEEVLRAEASQWGQVEQGTSSDTTPGPAAAGQPAAPPSPRRRSNP